MRNLETSSAQSLAHPHRRHQAHRCSKLRETSSPPGCGTCAHVVRWPMLGWLLHVRNFCSESSFAVEFLSFLRHESKCAFSHLHVLPVPCLTHRFFDHRASCISQPVHKLDLQNSLPLLTDADQLAWSLCLPGSTITSLLIRCSSVAFHLG